MSGQKRSVHRFVLAASGAMGIFLAIVLAAGCERKPAPAPPPPPAAVTPIPTPPVLPTPAPTPVLAPTPAPAILPTPAAPPRAVLPTAPLSREMPPEARPSLVDPQKPLPKASQAALGKDLFFDKSLSGDRELSCATCHKPDKAWSDGLALSIGYPETMYFRNTQSLLNSGSQPTLYWDGRFVAADMQSLVRDHLTEAHFLNMDGPLMAERLIQKPDYVELFKDVFGGEPSFGRVLAALEAYVKTLNSAPGPYDRYKAGEKSALSASAAKGLELFEGKAGCAQCHSGPLLSDGKFHSLGVSENPDIFQDPLRHITFRRFFRTLGLADYRGLRNDVGLFALTQDPIDRGKFRTPALRDVARTSPYMHNGMFKTLEQVVQFYSKGGGDSPNKDAKLRPLNLNQEEVAAIVAFLESLNGELVQVAEPRIPTARAISLGKGTITAPARKPSPPLTASKPPSIGPLPPVPIPPDNPMSDVKVQLGKLLFFDPRMSGDGSTACAGCHVSDKGWGDGGQVSRGYPGTSHWRNSQTVLNSAYFNKLFWAGEVTSLESQAASAWTSPLAGNLDPIMAEERMAQVPEYVRLFQEAFGTRPNWDNALRAVAAFERTLVSQNAPFDKHMKGDKTALSSQAVRGLDLFQGKAKCIQCHNGALFSDDSFHNIGVPKNAIFEREIDAQTAMRWQHLARGVPEGEYRQADRDLGLYYTTKLPEDKGKFRTPTLRELRYSAPYMHDGVFNTLSEVVEFYDKGGGDDPNKSPLVEPLNLSKEEQAALVAFLESLSGDAILMAEPEIPDYKPVP